MYEELIEIIGKLVQDEIASQINNLDTKYYSIVADSTPDVNNVDQLVMWFVTATMENPERGFWHFYQSKTIYS